MFHGLYGARRCLVMNRCCLLAILFCGAACAREGVAERDSGTGVPRRGSTPQTLDVAALEISVEVTRGPGPEEGSEVGPVSGPEAGPEAGREAGPEAGPEAGREAGREAGPESGPEVRPCDPACLVGCNVGCSPTGSCLSCSTCSCDVTTGQCHC